MSRSQKDILESIDNRLKYLLKLQAKENFDEEATIKQKVKQLHPMGFSNQEMADIIGTTSKTVAARKSDLKSEDKIE